MMMEELQRNYDTLKEKIRDVRSFPLTLRRAAKS